MAAGGPVYWGNCWSGRICLSVLYILLASLLFMQVYRYARAGRGLIARYSAESF